MANPLYQMFMGQRSSGMPMPAPNPVPSPINKMQAIMQAMANPAAFVRQQFPDMPNEISNNPNQILSWLQQTRGVSNQQIQQAQQQAGQIIGNGMVR